ncbi:MAG: CHASE domain-containing protein [Vampirovibrio sp.]|nr:CHASE domain-containing protein [Vampirovibrio sp.]
MPDKQKSVRLFLAIVIGLAVVNFVGASVGKLLAIPPGNVTPVWPPAGVGLAAVLMLGYRYWPGIWLGSFAFNLYFFIQNGQAIDGAILLCCAGIGAGSSVQALVGAYIAKNYMGFRLDAWKLNVFVKTIAAGGPICSVIAPSIGTVTLILTGVLPEQQMQNTWVTWWFGDTVGVVIFTSLLLIAYEQYHQSRTHDVGERDTHVWKVFSGVLMLIMIAGTLWGWHVMRARTEMENEIRFEKLVVDGENKIENRLLSYMDALHGATGLIHASENVEADEWRAYVRALEVETRYPGILGIGYIARVPEKNIRQYLNQVRQTLFPDFKRKIIHPEVVAGKDPFIIQFIEPYVRNKEARGLDIGSEKVRRKAAQKAWDTGNDQVTGIIDLVQDHTNHPGFLLLSPVYKEAAGSSPEKEMRDKLTGWVYAPFIGQHIFHDIFSSDNPEVRFAVYDGEISNEKLIYGSIESPEMSFWKGYTQRNFEFAGRIWVIVWETTPYFKPSLNGFQPLVILVFGLLSTLLMGALLLNLNTARDQAVQAVQKATRELQEINRSLQKSESRFRSAMDNAATGMALVAPAGRFIRVNTALCKMLGYTVDELLSRTFQDITHPDDMEINLELLRQVVDGEAETYQLEKRYFHKSGQIVWVRLGVSLVRDDEGQPLYLVAQAQDITEQHQIQAELMDAKEEALRALKLKSEFLATMSHEIRTPMNGILGMTEILFKTEVSPIQRKYLDMVYSSGVSLLTIINDILDFSKIEAGKLALETTGFNLKSFMDETLYPFQQQAEEKGILLWHYVHPDLPDLLKGDPTRIRQIVNNLVGNALKFTHQGRVEVMVEREPDCGDDKCMLHFRVSDTGIGLSEEEKSLIFQPFTQADGATTRKYGGTGLGLSISSHLVEMMEGKLWVESEKGKGSVFHFTTCLNVLDEKVDSKSDSAYKTGPASQVLPQSVHVLLVEDNEINQVVAINILEDAGYRVKVAGDGKEALAIFQGETFDIIFMDVHMPEMDGFEATVAIRDMEKTTGRHIPIVALTANAIQGDREKCLAAGMDDYISKPFKSQDVLEVVAKLVQVGQVDKELKQVYDEDHLLTTALGGEGDLNTVYVEETDVFIDREKVMDRLGGSTELLTKIVELFHQKYPEQLSDIRQAIQQRNPNELHESAHGLKGAIGNFTDEGPYEIVRRLELMGREQDLTDAQSVYGELEASLNGLASALDRFVQTEASVER